MIAPEAGLSVSRQCARLGIARSSFYYRPRPESAKELELLKRLDRMFTDNPIYGSRRLQVALLREGISTGRRRAAADANARAVGGQAEAEHQQAASRAPGLSVPSARRDDRPAEPGMGRRHNIHTDAAGVFVPGRDHRLGNPRVLSWRLSNTLTAAFCVEALSEALARFGKPGIFNTDQGAQFTSDAFTKILTDHGIAISMDGRGRCHDNIFVERLWWTVKHEWVYLRPAPKGIEQKRSLGECFDWYDLRLPHQALGWRTPDEAYLGQSTAATALAA